MKELPILGIDMAKRTFSVCLIVGGEEHLRVFSNTDEGFGKLAKWLARKYSGKTHACMEATGGYGDDLCAYLHENGHKVSVVNPIRIRNYRRVLLKRNKTDKSDARLIARFCEKERPEYWKPLRAETVKLRRLTRRVAALGKMIRMERNRREFARDGLEASIDRVIEALEKEVALVSEAISMVFKESPEFSRRKELLESIPALAGKSAELLLSEIDFDNYDSARSAASESGMTPGRSQSGTSLDKASISRIGKKRLRSGLYLPACSALRCNPPVMRLAKRMRANGKTGKQVVCASVRKLIHIAYGVIKNDEPFSQDRELQYDFSGK